MITAQIATLPDRVESLKLVVESLRPQVDRLFIALNGHKEVPEFILKDPFIEYKLLDNSLGDAAKFYDIEKQEGYFFACDDDLIYPETYVQDMIKKVDQYGAVVTLHGRSFLSRPVASYYKSANIKYYCRYDVYGDHVVDVGGTGVMAFHTDNFKLKLSDFKRANMADIWVAKQVHEQKVNIIVVQHDMNYLRYIPQTYTIWDSEHIDDSFQTEILNSFLK